MAQEIGSAFDIFLPLGYNRIANEDQRTKRAAVALVRRCRNAAPPDSRSASGSFRWPAFSKTRRLYHVGPVHPHFPGGLVEGPDQISSATRQRKPGGVFLFPDGPWRHAVGEGDRAFPSPAGLPPRVPGSVRRFFVRPAASVHILQILPA